MYQLWYIKIDSYFRQWFSQTMNNHRRKVCFYRIIYRIKATINTRKTASKKSGITVSLIYKLKHKDKLKENIKRKKCVAFLLSVVPPIPSLLF